jgi:hypothetical protein
MLTVECVGARLSGYLDGRLLFALTDVELTAGRIGLYCWHNTGARFTEVRVAPLTWTPYYTFSEEERLPAGKRVHVLSGNEADAPPAEPTLERRFVAGPGDPGLVRLPPDGTDVRVLAPHQGDSHTRRFLPTRAYVPLPDARVLRKADGTALFVALPNAPSGGVPPHSPPYRLQMAFRRNNQSVDPQSQVLREVDSATAEVVTLDIPGWAHGDPE